MSLAGFLFRRIIENCDKKRDRGLTTPPDIVRTDNLCYGVHGEWNLMDIYYPKAAEGKLPVIISIHGGGWVYGSKEVYQYYCMSLAQKGFLVVNFNYRLAPSSKFPAPLEDTNQVLYWLFEHADEYPMDVNSIFFVGDSAGANIAALYSCLCTNPNYSRMLNIWPPKGFVPKAVALNCGIYDIHLAVEKNRAHIRDIMTDYLGKDGIRKNLGKINVCRFVTDQFPPTYLMTSHYDFLRSQAPLLREKLDEFHVKYRYKIYGMGQKEVSHVFHCNMKLPEAARCNEEECGFFLNLLHKGLLKDTGR